MRGSGEAFAVCVTIVGVSPPLSQVYLKLGINILDKVRAQLLRWLTDLVTDWVIVRLHLTENPQGLTKSCIIQWKCSAVGRSVGKSLLTSSLADAPISRPGDPLSLKRSVNRNMNAVLVGGTDLPYIHVNAQAWIEKFRKITDELCFPHGS